MKNFTNEIKVGMFLNYISMFIESIAIFILNPFIIRGLGQETYGVYTLMTSFTGYLSLFEFGLGTTIIRYVAKYNATKEERKKEEFLSICFIIYAIIAVLISITAIILYNHLDSIFSNSLTLEQITLAKKLFIIISSSIIITTLGSIFSAIISGYEKFIFSRLLIITTTIINLVLTSIILLVNVNAVNITLVTLIIACITIITNIIYVIFKLKVKIRFHKIDKDFFNEIFKFSILIFIQTLISQIYWRLDQLIIGVEIKDAATKLAIYAVAMKLNDLILAFSTVVNRYQLPTITKLTLNNKDDELLDYLGKTSRIVAVIYLAIIIGFTFFGSKFIEIYAGSEYQLAYYIVLIVIIASALSRIHGCGSDVLKAKNLHGTYTTIILVTAILNIILTVILIPYFGIIGATLGTAVSLILGNTLAYYWCLKVKAKINIKELFKKTFASFIPVIIISIISGYILNIILDNNIINYLLKLIIFGIIYALLIFKYVISDDTKKSIFNKIKRRMGYENKI